nr:transposase [Pseudonocardia sp. MH-G8]
MSESYEGQQIVGMDLHRRRSLLVRMTESGQRLETVRISNDPEYLREVMTRAGEAPEVVLEATYGWYWVADALAGLGASVHLAHPLGVKMFSYRRVKNDERDAADLADLLRMGRLPEAWIAPPATRELRGWVRHRAKLVGLRSNLSCQVHAVLAAAGVQVPMSDLFGPGGQQPLATTRLAVESRSRVDSLLRVIAALDFEIDTFARLVAGRLRGDPGYTAIQVIPGGRAAARGGVRRRDRRHHPLRPPAAAGLLGRADPQTSRVRYHRAPRPDHQARIPAGSLGRGRGGATRARPYPAQTDPRPGW